MTSYDMAVDNVSMNVPIKIADSRSNGFRDIRGLDFVSNERTLAKPIPIVRNAKRFVGFRLMTWLSHFSWQTVPNSWSKSLKLGLERAVRLSDGTKLTLTHLDICDGKEKSLIKHLGAESNSNMWTNMNMIRWRTGASVVNQGRLRSGHEPFAPRCVLWLNGAR